MGLDHPLHVTDASAIVPPSPWPPTPTTSIIGFHPAERSVRVHASGKSEALPGLSERASELVLYLVAGAGFEPATFGL